MVVNGVAFDQLSRDVVDDDAGVGEGGDAENCL